MFIFKMFDCWLDDSTDARYSNPELLEIQSQPFPRPFLVTPNSFLVFGVLGRLASTTNWLHSLQPSPSTVPSLRALSLQLVSVRKIYIGLRKLVSRTIQLLSAMDRTLLSKRSSRSGRRLQIQALAKSLSDMSIPMMLGQTPQMLPSSLKLTFLE